MSADTPHDPPGRKPPDGASKPDWLVGADEGLDAELQRTDAAHEPVRPTLVRPDAGAPALPTRNDSDPARMNLAAPHFPAMEVEQGVFGPSRGAIDGRSARFDDEAYAPAFPEEPWQADVPKDEGAVTVDPRSSLATAQIASAAQRAPFPDLELVPDPPIIEKAPPLWQTARDLLRTNRMVQGALLAVLLVWLAWATWPQWRPGDSLAGIRHHASQFDGRAVRVKGKVGEVFPVGGGYTFYLQQGRDTIVVFTRTRVPVERQHVTIEGHVSTGFLDGLPRQALFEDTTPPKP